MTRFSSDILLPFPNSNDLNSRGGMTKFKMGDRKCPFLDVRGEGGQRFGCLKNPIIIQNAISLFPIKKKTSFNWVFLFKRNTRFMDLQWAFIIFKMKIKMWILCKVWILSMGSGGHKLKSKGHFLSPISNFESSLNHFGKLMSLWRDVIFLA